MTRFDALRLIASTIAGTESPERWQGLDASWPIVLETATGHRVAAVLYSKLEQAGLREELPAPLADTLWALRELGRERNAAIRAQAIALAHVLNRRGMAPLFLKGTAHLLSGLHAGSGDRLIGDIDLLIPREQHPEALAALREAGYRVQDERLLHADGAPRGDIHFPALAHPAQPMLVEMHWRTLPPRFHLALPEAEALARAVPMVVEDAQCLVLRADDALVHNLLHAEERHHLLHLQNTELFRLWDSLLLERAAGDAELGEAVERLREAGFSKALRHHAGAMTFLFGEAALPAALRCEWHAREKWWLEETTNQRPLARYHQACLHAGIVAARNAADLSRQWRHPQQRRALLVKVSSPGSYWRRGANSLRMLLKKR